MGNIEVTIKMKPYKVFLPNEKNKMLILRCPITPLRMVTRTVGCDMVIFSWMCSTVGKFLIFSSRSESARNKTKMIRIMVLVGVKHTKILLPMFVTESIT